MKKAQIESINISKIVQIYLLKKVMHINKKQNIMAKISGDLNRIT